VVATPAPTGSQTRVDRIVSGPGSAESQTQAEVAATRAPAGPQTRVDRMVSGPGSAEAQTQAEVVATPAPAGPQTRVDRIVSGPSQTRVDRPLPERAPAQLSRWPLWLGLGVLAAALLWWAVR
jgi:hypothetical protein